jgi:hypothetical protein
MADNIPWRKNIEELLAGAELIRLSRERSAKVQELLDIIGNLEMPSGEYANAAVLLMTDAAKELPKEQAVYICFMIGIAYEKIQNKEN